MILLPGARVHEAANKNPGRWLMDHVRVRVEGGQPLLEATDGRVAMVRVPARWAAVGEAEAWPRGEELLLPRAALVELFKGRADEERHVLVSRPVGGVPEFTLRRGALELKVSAMVGEFAPASSARWPTYDVATTVTLDVEALVRVAKATGADALQLAIPPASEGGVVVGAVLVRAVGAGHKWNGSVAALAPIVPEDGVGGGR